MALLPFDELNTPQVEVEPPEQYFSKMAISKEQKEERVETANDLMDVLLFFFALLAIEMESVSPDYDMVYRKFKKRFRDVVADHSRMDDYQNNYVDEYTLQQYELTRRHMEAAGVGSGNTDAGWWTSADRAMAIGENAANIILNHEELLQAAEAGAVGKKWIDKADNRVRKSHLAVTKKIMPLEEYFVVGDGVMLHPLDWDNNPDQCYNCRCVCHYFDKNGKLVKIGNALNKGGENEDSNKREKSLLQETRVRKDLLDKDVLRKKISVLGEDANTNRHIVDNVYDTLKHRDGTHYEDLSFVDTVRHKSDINKDYDYYVDGVSQCTPNRPMRKLLREANENQDRSVIGIHNHPSSIMVSMADLYYALKRRYKYGLVFTHNGKMFKYSVNDTVNLVDLFDPKSEKYNAIQAQLDKLEIALYNKDSERMASAIENLSGKGIDFEVFQ